MPREIITLQARHAAHCAASTAPQRSYVADAALGCALRPRQVGQCGNQIGCRFWELALREHAAHNKGGRYDEALSSFFANVDTRSEPPAPLPLGDGRGAIRTLRVRDVAGAAGRGGA